MRSLRTNETGLWCSLLGLCWLLVLPAWGATNAAEPLTIRFDSISTQSGLILSITTTGDTDGRTTFSNKDGAGVENAQKFVRDVHIHAGDRSLRAVHDASGWTVEHKPGELLTVSYRLLPSGPTKIDSGPAEQFRPLIHQGLFHLLGGTSLLLPVGREESDPVKLDIDATAVADDGKFVSSFGPGRQLHDVPATRKQLTSALYLGGPITLSLHDTASGRVGVAYSAMDPTIDAEDLRNDALSIIETERKFFNDSQPWYLVSLHGGTHQDPAIFLGGGTGLTNSFAMFAASSLDFSNAEQREQFRWVLAHEYFHQWNGLTLRVASQAGTDDDDASVYWFSEGVTEFYTMRLLTRAGLQSPERSRDVLNNKLQRYAANSKRGVGAEAAGALFWTDADGEQIPYLRGYLAAWYADIALHRDSDGQRSLDTAMQMLVQRARAEPDFRVDNAFLAAYLATDLPSPEKAIFRNFVIEGGETPLDTGSFSPCMQGKQELISDTAVLQFDFADRSAPACFMH